MRRPIRRREAGDSNRDGVVKAADVMAVHSNNRRGLPPFTAPAAAGPAGRAAAAESGAVPTPSARPPALPRRRGVLGAAAPARSILDGILDLDQAHRRQGA